MKHNPARIGGGAMDPPEIGRPHRSGARPIGVALAAALILVLLVSNASAQSAPMASLVEDIYPGPTGSQPNHLSDFKGTLLFGAKDPRFGEELWKSSDATAAGTDIVEDLNPGITSVNNVEAPNSSEPDKVMLTKRWLYFAATTQANGEELFRSDGTAAGTDIVKDIVPGAGSSGAEDFEPVSSTTTFFRAFHPDVGEELWKTDGTAAGTTLVKDINPDTPPGARCPQNQCGIPKGWSHPDTLTAMGRTVYFAADDGVHGVELWKSNGTAAGTVLVKDINTTPGNNNPGTPNAVNGSAEIEKLFVKGGTLYFRANDGVSGVELWKSDGTAAGTVRVKDINPAPPAPTTTACKRAKSCAGSSFVDEFAVANGKVYFTANDGTHGVELWKTDGRASGTVLVKDINPSSATRASDVGEIVPVGRKVFFRANDGTHGVELWRSDSTAAGTVLVKDINPGAAPSSPDQLTNFKKRLFFAANDGVSGTELWRSDGTAAGTTLRLDVEPGPGGSEPSGLTVSGNHMYFAASNPSAGEELWAVSTNGFARRQ